MTAAFWALTGACLIIVGRKSEKNKARNRLKGYEEILTRDSCEDYSIRSTRFWAVEERDDEGPVYAFELSTGGVVFVTGQDFYPSAKFPNTDFSLVEFKDNQGGLVEFLIEKRGQKIGPEKIISSQIKKSWETPTLLTFSEGSLESVFDTIPT